jgi:PIN domain nuclease of toxin-antitoxin system
MICVLDACAVIALLRGESGNDVVWRYVSDSSMLSLAHSINLCEVYYDFYRAGGERAAVGAINDLKALGVIERNDFDQAFWQEAGRIKANQKRVSLADCFAITLTNRVGGVMLTSDHQEFDPIATQGICQVTFFR